MSREQHVAVIGGGIIGIASAHFLSERGYRVTVVDQGSIGGACSHGNCGLVSPSHILPLAQPGMLGSSVAESLRQDSALRIGWRLDWSFLKWMWRFASRCNQSDMLQSAGAIHPLLVESKRLYDKLVSSDGLACEWQSRGLMFVYRDRVAFDRSAEEVRVMEDQFGHRTERVESKDLLEREPSLRRDLAGAWYHNTDAHLRPDRLINSWVARLKRSGVRFVERTRWLHLQDESNRRTSAGLVRSAVLKCEQADAVDSLQADHFVIATGAWTPKWDSALGVRIPIEPGKGYSVMLPRPDRCPSVPMIFPQEHVAVTPMKSGLRLGSMMEFVGYDRSIDPDRIEFLRRGAAKYLVAPLPESHESPWFGWRPMTIDSTPVIGACPGFKNVVLAAGHNMLGLSMAPATGRIVADLISGRASADEIHRYRADRLI
ncbi:MAG: FAD-dependent oxidoreductase [Planctomycetota bacterium]